MFSMAFSICNSVFLLYKKDKEKTHHLTMKSHFLIQECPDELLVRVRAKRVLDTLFWPLWRLLAIAYTFKMVHGLYLAISFWDVCPREILLCIDWEASTPEIQVRDRHLSSENFQSIEWGRNSHLRNNYPDIWLIRVVTKVTKEELWVLWGGVTAKLVMFHLNLISAGFVVLPICPEFP